MNDARPERQPILYISYDGLTDPLGRSQVLPYLIGCAARGHRIVILSCEKPELLDREGEGVRSVCAASGIEWHPLRYHKSPPVLSSVYDAAALKRAAASLHRKHNFKLTHCRSYIPASAGLSLKQRFGVPLLFDMRGFWPDERVDGKSWNLANPVYRAVYQYFKRLERRLLREADHIISLTHRGKAELLTRAALRGEAHRITVIPCCVDFDHFPLVGQRQKMAVRSELGIPAESRVLNYIGSLGTWYMLDEMLDFFKVYHKRYPGAVFLFITREDPQSIELAAKVRGIGPAQLVIRGATREEVPRLAAAADLGIFFINPVFSKIASSPTKMGETVALGLPLVTNSGVGDVSQIVAETGCGAVVERFDEAAYGEVIDAIEASSGSPKARREKAFLWFDVEIGIDRYDTAYRRISAP